MRSFLPAIYDEKEDYRIEKRDELGFEVVPKKRWLEYSLFFHYVHFKVDIYYEIINF